MANQLLILGAGESGASAARLGQREGYEVFVSDAGSGNPQSLKELDAAGIEYEVGGHTRSRMEGIAEVIKSPGIPDNAALIQDLRNSGASVISEIEFASRFVDANSTVVGITGSNGKTTTTMLTQHLLEVAGKRSRAGGNLGESFARLLLDYPVQEIYVLELSSFQLDGIVDFRPRIAAILNITPDHLDRYGYILDNYADSKFRIARNQLPTDKLLLLEDTTTMAPAHRRNKVNAEVSWINPAQAIEGSDIQVAGHTLHLAETQLKGRHNAMNALFAARIALLLGVGPEDLQRGLETFRPAPHRMEIIGTHDGRTWINDSKATNVDSTFFALEAMQEPTVWIAGGTDKGNDYTALQEVAQEHVHTLICLGADNSKLRAAFTGTIGRIEECNTAEKAVELAAHFAGIGDTILLSPACASFDLFKNYMDRGDQFRDSVKRTAL